MSQLKISVVIPTFNRRERLATALNSVLRQTRPVDEIVVVDDGSTDNTADMLEEFALRYLEPTLRIIRQLNRGPAAARNAGIRAASGDWIAFLDDDDVWLPEKIERQLAALNKKPGVCMLGCATDTFELSGGARLISVGEWRMLFRNWFLTPSVLVRREVLMDCGGFPEDMHHCEDYALWLKIVMRCKCAFLNEKFVQCGHGKPSFGHSGLSGDLSALRAGELEAIARWSKYRDAGCLVTLLAKTLALMRDYRRRIVATAFRKNRNA